MSRDHRPCGRRGFLRGAVVHASRLAAATAAVGAFPAIVRAAPQPAQRLVLAHTHTGERLELDLAAGGAPVPSALAALNLFLRDHYSGEVGRIDPGLVGALQRVQALAGGSVFEVISGFRGAFTNERLRRTRGGGVARHSLHLEGRAVDVRLAGVPLADLRDAAVALRAGGVGFYPQERFVHLDTGRVRSW